MKIIWVIVTLSVFVIGCNNNQQVANKNETHAEEEKYDHDGAGKLELNNGAKWKADSGTNNNVKGLQAIVDKFNDNSARSTDTYHSTAIGLQAGLEKMITECKMKGPDHHALHLWLEPLVTAIAKLKKTVNDQEGSAVLKEIEEHLKLYGQYFE